MAGFTLGWSLYKIKTDGTGRIKLNDDISYYPNVIGDWIYENGSDGYKLYKIKINGTGKQVVN